MSAKREKTVSAQVVLRSASGKSVTGEGAITSANVRDYMPSQETFTAAAEAYSKAGFEVSAAGPTGFSITAPVSTFEKVFHTRVRKQESGGFEAARKDQGTTLELPLRELPRELSQPVEAVTFTPPPEFGPTSF